MKKQKVRKNAKFKKLPFCQKLIVRRQTSLCNFSMCLLLRIKSIRYQHKKTLAQIEFPVRMKVKRVKCCHFVKKTTYFLAIKYFHAYVQCLYIVYAKHQISAAKALVQVE